MGPLIISHTFIGYPAPFVALTIGVCAIFDAIHLGVYPGWRLMLPYAAIFSWALYRPDALKIMPLLVIGLLQDTLLHLPLGVSMGEFWLMWWLSMGQRGFLVRQHFGFSWFSFAVASIVVFGVRTALLSLLTGHIPCLDVCFFDLASLVILYPLIAAGVLWLSVRMKGQEG